ncbi:Adenylate kinase 5 [Nymphaea thermarum]|nr:Adenylate kinase 5 [Nymphaea thermarum]
MAFSTPFSLSLAPHYRSFASPCSDASPLALSSPRLPTFPLSLPLSSSASCSSVADLRGTGIRLDRSPRSRRGVWRVCAVSKHEPLKVMISGAPASGKGTQCEFIVKKYGLVHISTGDLLRAEVSSGTKIGVMVKKFMENGLLVPDDIVTDIVKARLSRQDAKEKGWLLDGYPRTLAQAQSLESSSIHPDAFLLLDVPKEVLIDRSTGRRMDPTTGKIYHLKYFPPETMEISSRLITRPDDIEEKVKARIESYNKNVEAVTSVYADLLIKVDGNRPKELVFESIDSLLNKLKNDKLKILKLLFNVLILLSYMIVLLNGAFNILLLLWTLPLACDITYSLDEATIDSSTAGMAPLRKENWRGIPTRLNNIPHSKDIREYFYDDVLQATQRAVQDKQTRLKVEINIPELNPEMDVYRIGTLMELVRAIALSFADDGKYVKVCVQGSMGEGALSGMPLQLAGSRRILEFMDWGEHGALGTFVNIGSIGVGLGPGHSYKPRAGLSPTPYRAAPGQCPGLPESTSHNLCLYPELKALTDAAGDRPVILVNPRLKDLPSSSGIMQVMGREARLEYASSFQSCYLFRLLYYAGTLYPIMGALRMSYPYKYELYRRVDEGYGKEKYVILSTFPERPTPLQINDAFEGKQRDSGQTTSGFW